MHIRKAIESDFQQILPIFREIIEKGDTYDFEETATDQDAFEYWFGKNVSCFVMESDEIDKKSGISSKGKILGFYKIIPNHRGRGSHVANASFMVASDVRKKGIGKKMGEDCLIKAKEMGFRAIQFNFVISTNEPAMRLWKSLGYSELCRLPGAFNHKKLGFVDAVIFYQNLV